MTADCIDSCCALASICNVRLALFTCKVDPTISPVTLICRPATAKSGARLPTCTPPILGKPFASFCTGPLITIWREFVGVALVAKISPFDSLNPCTRTFWPTASGSFLALGTNSIGKLTVWPAITALFGSVNLVTGPDTASFVLMLDAVHPFGVLSAVIDTTWPTAKLEVFAGSPFTVTEVLSSKWTSSPLTHMLAKPVTTPTTASFWPVPPMPTSFWPVPRIPFNSFWPVPPTPDCGWWPVPPIPSCGVWPVPPMPLLGELPVPPMPSCE